MDSRKKLRKQYESRCRRVAEILADEDLVGITEGNPDPIEEYSVEASEIVRRVAVALRTPQVVDQGLIAAIVSDVFRSEFEVEIESSEALQIASRVEGELR